MDVLSYKSFGQALKAYRALRAENEPTGIFYQKDLVDALVAGGYVFSTKNPVKLVSDWELDHGDPSYRTVQAVAGALGLTIDELLTCDKKLGGTTRLKMQKEIGLSESALYNLKLLKDNRDPYSKSTLSFVNAFLEDSDTLHWIGVYTAKLIEAYALLIPHLFDGRKKRKDVTIYNNVITDFWGLGNNVGTSPDEAIDVANFRISEIFRKFMEEYVLKKGAEKHAETKQR